MFLPLHQQTTTDMKNLTAKQLDNKFAKAQKLAEELLIALSEIEAGCSSFNHNNNRN